MHNPDTTLLSNSYIPLDRKFSTFSSSTDNPEENWDFIFNNNNTGNLLNWKDLLKKDIAIILAEAGTGKTEELKAVAADLNNQNKNAFFCRIEMLAELDFVTALDIGDEQKFADWKSSSDTAYFFLDSVDEAKLQDPRNFEIALRKFVKTIGKKNISRANIFVTSRFTEWRSVTDLSKVCSIFQIPVPKITDNSLCFKLEPLNDDQIKTFASAHNIESTKEFLDAIERADIKIFASRPQDLLDLITYWKDHSNRFGRYIEMLNYNIQQKLLEKSPSRKSTLPPQEALEGAQRLAAATTLIKKNKIRLPNDVNDSDLLAVSFSPQEVLNDWDDKSISELLTRPVFDEAIYGSVRFHHRSVREFLTAKWLLSLLEKGSSRRKIESILFVSQYGREVAIPSMQPITAWLSCWDENIRNKVLKIAPEVLLECGDPSGFSVGFRIHLLNRVIKEYKNQHYTDLQVDPALIKRLATPDMSEVINRHLIEHANNHDLSRLLLEMVWHGKIHKSIHHTIKLALNKHLSNYVRTTALRAVLSIGDDKQKASLIRRLVAEGKHGRKVLQYDVFELFPKLLTVDDLVLLIKSFSKERGSLSFDYYLENLFKTKEFDNDILLDLLTKILPLIHQKPFCRDYGNCDISKKYAWVLSTALLVANKVIEQDKATYSNTVIQDSFLSYLSIGNNIVGYSSVQKELNNILSNLDRDFYYRLFWKAVEIKKNYHGRPIKTWDRVSFAFNHRMIWKPQLEDWDKLSKEITKRIAPNQQHVALSALYYIYTESCRSKSYLLRPLLKLKSLYHLIKLKHLIKDHPELIKSLKGWLNPPPPTKEDLKWKKEEKEYEKQDIEQEKKEIDRKNDWKQHIQKHQEDLFEAGDPQEGSIFQETSYLYDWLRNKSDYSSDNLISAIHLLNEEFGEKIADSFQKGCINYWRKYDPLKCDSYYTNQIPYSRLISLFGLQLEAKSNSEWPKNLSSAEASRAASIALFELNEFPDWYQQLHKYFPDEVKDTILQEVAHELSADFHDNFPSILSRLNHTPYIDDYKKELLNLIENNSDAHYESIQATLRLLLRNEINTKFQQQLANLAIRNFSKQAALKDKMMWLTLLFLVSAKTAIVILKCWLSQLPNEKARQDIIVSLFSNLGDRHNSMFTCIKPDFKNIASLKYLVPLAYQYIRVEDDLHHKGTYSPGPRDEAQDNRGLLLEALATIPSKDSYDFLIQWAKTTNNQRQKDYLLRLAKNRAETDAALNPWSEEDISSFENTSDINPKSEQDLFSLVKSRIYDLKDDYEKADNSIAKSVQKIEAETELRNLLHREFEKASKAKYTIAQEEEYTDGKRTDIRFHIPSIPPVPVELKIANKWSFNELHERLENQLIKQYMKVSKYGVFLLVHREEKYWIDSEGNKYNYPKLIEALNHHAQVLVKKYKNIEDIQVIGIDLTIRHHKEEL